MIITDNCIIEIEVSQWFAVKSFKFEAPVVGVRFALAHAKQGVDIAIICSLVAGR